MKKLMKSLMLFAAAAMAFTSCEKEPEINKAQDNFVTMTFFADAPDSRTSVSIDGDVANYSWSETGEFLKFFQYAENKSSFYQQKSDEGKVEENKATFTVKFSNKADGVDTYYYSAIYPNASVINKGTVDAVEVKIPNEQTLTVNSFDPAADLMVAEPIWAQYNSEDIYELRFTRLAAVGRMKIKGLSEGEKILKVDFSFAGGTNFVGSATVDLEASALGENPGNSNKLTLTANGDYPTSADGTYIYFTCFPGEYSGDYTLEVETDKATYINTGKSISAEKALTFKAGDVLGFNISAGERTEKEGEAAAWVKISDLSDLAVGDQVALVGTVGSTNYGMSTNGTTSAPGAVPITIENNAIALTSINSITTFNVGKDGSNYILYEGETQATWLYCNNSNNGVRSGTSANKTWAIAKHTKGGANFQFKHVSTGRFLGVYDKQDWRCYTTVNATNFTNGNGTSDIAIYKLSEGTGGGEEPEQKQDQTLSFDPATATATIGEDFDEPTLKGAVTTVTYTSSDTNVAEVNATTGEVTLKAAGTTIITATAEAAEGYNAAEASYELTVEAAQGGGGDEGGSEETYSVTNFLSELGLSGTTTLTADKAYAIGDDITMTVNKGTGQNIPAVNKDNTLRIYTNTKMTLSSEKTIVRVVFTFSSSSNATINTVNTGNYDTKTYTWTGSAKSVTFSTTSSTQARIKTMTITYK